ncbi:hypothetical protein K474DRAFT_1658521, partial [Panus rudis PR-1116 ss-1]
MLGMLRVAGTCRLTGSKEKASGGEYPEWHCPIRQLSGVGRWRELGFLVVMVGAFASCDMQQEISRRPHIDAT